MRLTLTIRPSPQTYAPNPTRRNYGEAIKCYLNALRIESSNLNILRDLANLQVREFWQCVVQLVRVGVC